MILKVAEKRKPLPLTRVNICFFGVTRFQHSFVVAVKRGLINFVYSTSCIKANLFFVQTNKCTLAKIFSCIFLLITPTCFDHSCDHLQGVVQ